MKKKQKIKYKEVIKHCLLSKFAFGLYLWFLLLYLPDVLIEDVFGTDITFAWCEQNYKKGYCSHSGFRGFFANIHILTYILLSCVSLFLIFFTKKLRKYFRFSIWVIIILGVFAYLSYTLSKYVTVVPYELYDPKTSKTIHIETV